MNFACRPRFSVRKSPDEFGRCHINVEKDRLSEGLQFLLFIDGSVYQIKTVAGRRVSSGNVLITWVLGGENEPPNMHFLSVVSRKARYMLLREWLHRS